MTARVAVIMRTKDRPLLLRRALASVEAQTFSDYTLVVVNDAGAREPVDELLGGLDAAFRERTVVIHNDTSAGREGAMNVGIDAVDSEFIVIHDDDDSWHPEFLERTVGRLDEHPEEGGVNARTEVVFERVEGEEIIEEGRDVLAADLHQVSLVEILKRNYVTTIGFLFRRSVFLEVGPIDGALPVLGDWEFLLRFLRRYPVGFVDGQPLAFWHQRLASTGDEGNSVVVAADEHRDFNLQIRDAYLRRSLEGGDRMGDNLFLAQLIDEVQSSGARQHDALAGLVQSHAEGAGEHRRRMEDTLDRIEERFERTARTVDDIRGLMELTRPAVNALRTAAKPAVSAARSLGRVGKAATTRRPRRAAPAAPAPAASQGVSLVPGIDAESAALPAQRTRTRSDASLRDQSAKRIAFYLFYDPLGVVDDYVVHQLREFRRDFDTIFVVVNGGLDDEGRARLESVADTVWQRENVGFDVWGFKEAQAEFGWDALEEFDELHLINYTNFGPLYPLAEVLDRMDDLDVDFWGMTEHKEVTPHPLRGVGTMPAHLQSPWLVVRKSMFSTPEYRQYWDEMPMITTYHQSVDRYETNFTPHFNRLGFTSRAAFPAENYAAANPHFENITEMLKDRVPIMKRRVFFHDPLHNDKVPIIARDALETVERTSDYPVELVYANLARTSQPRNFHTNASMMEILPDQDLTDPDVPAPSVAVICHLYYDDLIDEIMAHVDNVPGAPDVFITTTDEGRRARILEGIARHGYTGNVDVRVIESNRGRDISAFLVGCHDVLTDERYELIVKIHGKKSVQDGFNAGQWFKRHLLENLLPNRGYTANLIDLFRREPGLGMVFPPVVHMGYPTLGHAWFANLAPAREFAARFGITVPFDDNTPLSPFGSMFVARRRALAPIVDAGWTWNDFPEADGYKDGGLAHVIERMLSYIVLNEGYHVRTAMNVRLAAISHTFLEYKLAMIGSELPGQANAQLHHLRNIKKSVWPSSPLAAAKAYIAVQQPGVAEKIRPAYFVARNLYRRLRGR
ncbi:glycosyltransferase [Pseudoclavibacter chungangensis]|uniref:Glycosyltransferase n=1 Tax=Pseudoclavibacter chungangensis TaxID=587635 RepID=A0A7J5BYN6_9MICO|nr:rhamnan synthesis F family protein [Pseudoclavibacter chungangensis]KAB1659476.1 glycosyltransferase [Pseudoclavibacter chungangensis]NYJ67667.1 lipopolysaccharide biosynthesis protein/glycosyltransferase involved in cell wall biosynthesis [Pseudoclavibacter chungangensis]